MTIFLIACTVVAGLAVAGLAAYYLIVIRRRFNADAARIDGLTRKLGKANAGWDDAYTAWETERAAYMEMKLRYDSLEDLHRRCISAKPVFLDPEPSVELTTWKTQTATRTMPVLELDLTATGAWSVVMPQHALPAGGA